MMVYSAEKSDKEALHKIRDGLKKLEKNLIVVLYEFAEIYVTYRGESTMSAMKPALDENIALLDKLIAKIAKIAK